MITITIDENVRGAIRATLRHAIRVADKFSSVLSRKRTVYLLATSKRGNPEYNPFFTMSMGEKYSHVGSHICLAKLTISGGRGKRALKFIIERGSEYFDESWDLIVEKEFHNAVSDLAFGMLQDEETTAFNTFG